MIPNSFFALNSHTAPATSELKFITDPDLRTNLRNDIGAINRALSNGEWKAATVLAGSAIEALLLWALQQRQSADITNAIAALRASGELTRQPDPNLERWDLHHFTEVAAHLGIIKPDTETEPRLAREFRNLIHPGLAAVLTQNGNNYAWFFLVHIFQYTALSVSLLQA